MNFLSGRVVLIDNWGTWVNGNFHELEEWWRGSRPHRGSVAPQIYVRFQWQNERFGLCWVGAWQFSWILTVFGGIYNWKPLVLLCAVLDGGIWLFLVEWTTENHWYCCVLCWMVEFEQPLTTVGQLTTAVGGNCLYIASIDHLWWVKGLEVSDFYQLWAFIPQLWSLVIQELVTL